MFVFSVLKNRFSSKKKLINPRSSKSTSSSNAKKQIPKPTLGALIDAFFLHRKLTNQVSKKQMILAAKQQNSNEKSANL